MSGIFTKIINQEIPSYKIYEDEYVYAFLDIRPFQKGHTLIIPKIEVDHMIDVPEPYYSAVWSISKKIGHALLDRSRKKKIANLVLGLEVPHAHIHLVPIDRESDARPNPELTLSEEEFKTIQQEILRFLHNNQNN